MLYRGYEVDDDGASGGDGVHGTMRMSIHMVNGCKMLS